MFDQMLQLVKEHFTAHPELTEAIPSDQTEDVHKEVASALTDHVQNSQPASSGVLSGLMNKVEGGLGSGGMLSNAIGGGLVSSLASKFGLPPAITGAIAASMPAILERFFHHPTTGQNNNN